MIRSAQRGKARRAFFSLLAVAALVSPAASQRDRDPSDFPGITLTEITSRLRISLPPIVRSAKAVTLPVSIRSQAYSLDYARQILVPALGGSVAVGEFNGDHERDLYVVVPGGSNHLLRGRPDGTFIDVTEKAGVGGTGADLGAAFCDFDKSGRQSLFVAGLGGLKLYRNNGDGSFTDATATAGLKGKPGELATSVSLFDADNDGFLDVLVTIYTDLSAHPSKPAFAFPNDFTGANSHLYRNQHDGTFVEVTEAAGLNSNPGRTLKAVAGDFNHQGRMDLLLLRDNKPPVLFRNQGKGRFEDQTWDAGAEIWKYAYVEAQTADFKHRDKLDVVLWSTIGNEVLLNQGNAKFKQDESLPLVYAANRPFGFHGLAADLNGDGYADLLTVDGRGAWHFIANRAGHFEEAPLTWSLEAAVDKPEANAPPAFASLRPTGLGKSGVIDLVGITVDGRVQVFETSRMASPRGPSGSPKQQ